MTAATPIPLFDLRAEAPSTALLELLEGRQAAFPADALQAVRAILTDVREHGDDALLRYTERFDGVRLSAGTLRLPAEALAAAAARATPAVVEALRGMIANVRAFHAPQRPEGYSVAGAHGATLRYSPSPVRCAALYVPGGTAAYPTTVVMNAVPAQIAGVQRLIVLTPPQTLAENPAVAAALTLLGLEEVYQVGGAQAIAAAAFGTATVPRADVIVGPGNVYVALAKREVYGLVGIDAVAGPSEVAILADDSAPPRFIAADLLAQAEHDERARCFLLTPSMALAEAVVAELGALLEEAPRRRFAAPALASHSAVVVVRDVGQLIELSNLIAAEHLQVMLDEGAGVAPEQLIGGAIFWGAYTPTALGDYWAGPNHVLPTGASARFAGPLGVATFMRTSSMVRYTAAAAAAAVPTAATLADHEQLHGHAQALRLRGAGGGAGPDHEP